MQCPKCRMEQEDRNLLCDYCGLVFSKQDALEPSTPIDTRITMYAPPSKAAGAWLRDRLCHAAPLTRKADLAWRAALLAFLAVWGLRLIGTTIESNGVGRSFLHLVNLPFHEAGHVFFSPFGDFVRTLGGTLGQLLMPFVCALVLLLRTRDAFGAGVALWWFGENFLDLAPYIDDAGTGELPLLGGNTGESTPYGFHDWEYLMTETGQLTKEHDLARASHHLGTAIMLFALGWMALTLWRGWRAGRESQRPTRWRTMRRAA